MHHEPESVARGYWEQLRQRCPDLQALFWRSPLEDFVPGISDLDLRLVSGPVAAERWPAIAEAVGQVHLESLRSGQEMWRLLEHPPGACVTVEEALDRRLSHPEMRQWQPCCGEDAVLDDIGSHVAAVPWSAADDLHWRRRLSGLLAPWGPAEDRINLPAGTERRYRLHVLVMLRTLPALQAAYCLAYRCAVPGKLAALRAWQSVRPAEPLLAELEELVTTELHGRLSSEAPDLDRLQDRCRRLVEEVGAEALAGVPEPEEGAGPTVAAGQALVELHDAVRFSRLRPAHYRGFLSAPDGFDTDFFLVNEIDTLRRAIVAPADRAVRVLGLGQGGCRGADTSGLAALCRSAAEREAVATVMDAAEASPSPDRARLLLLRALQWYPPFHAVLERALAAGLERQAPA